LPPFLFRVARVSRNFQRGASPMMRLRNEVTR